MNSSDTNRGSRPLAVMVGAGGLAMALARRLGASYRLLLADIDELHLERKVAELRADEGHDAAGVACDVTEPAAVAALADDAQRAGPVRALVHVVGLSPSMAEGSSILRVNLTGATLVANAFEELAGPGTAALFVASMAGHMRQLEPAVIQALDDPVAANFMDRVTAAMGSEIDSVLAYQLSKAGLIRMCADRAWAWGQRGARILSISPGIIDTAQGASEFEAQPEKRRIFAYTPLRRQGTTSEIADLVEFLVSDRASFITGTDVLIDGGLTAALHHGHGPRG